MDHFSHDPFDESSEDSADRGRSAARDSLFLAANFAVGQRPPVQVRVRNLSAGGLMAEYAQQVAIGDPVKIDLRGIGVIDGRIAWVAEGRVGVAFASEIDPMLARKPVGKGTTTPVYVKPVLASR